MKRIFAQLLTVMMLFAAGIPFTASELIAESEDLSVIYSNHCEGLTVPVTEEGASGVLPNGVAFSASDLPNGATTLRIYPVSEQETEVRKWIEDTLPAEYDATVSYYVVCSDANGNELSNEGIRITIDAPNTEKELTLFSLSSDGNSQKVSATNGDNTLSFSATGDRMYSVSIAAANPPTASGSIALLAVCALLPLAFAGLILLRRKARTSP